jgi:sulfopyruvate decarboxylase alpha subunit
MREEALSWAETMLQCLKQNEVRLCVYVPDEVLTPLINGAEADPAMTTFAATREEEAIGIVGGAALAGQRGVVLMQSSGFGNSVNALASFAVPYQLPVLMIIGERGVLGEFNPVQVPISRTIRPALDALGIFHRTLDRVDELVPAASATIRQCFNTNTPAAMLITPLLTGGKADR